jgi:hypothetical protein
MFGGNVAQNLSRYFAARAEEKAEKAAKEASKKKE